MRSLLRFMFCALTLMATSAHADDLLPPTIIDTLRDQMRCLDAPTEDLMQECSDQVTRDQPDWTILTARNQISGLMDVSVLRQSANDEGTALAVHCDDGGVAANLRSTFSSPPAGGLFNMVRNDWRTIKVLWHVTSDGDLITTDPWAIYPLMGAWTLDFEIPLLSGETKSLHFDTTGFDEAARWFELECISWDPSAVVDHLNSALPRP